MLKSASACVSCSAEIVRGGGAGYDADFSFLDGGITSWSAKKFSTGSAWAALLSGHILVWSFSSSLLVPRLVRALIRSTRSVRVVSRPDDLALKVLGSGVSGSAGDSTTLVP